MTKQAAALLKHKDCFNVRVELMQNASERLLAPASSQGELFISMFALFGVASISYWWSRLAAALARILHYVLGKVFASWLMVFADDFMVNATGRYFVESSLFSSLVRQSAKRCPISATAIASVLFGLFAGVNEKCCGGFSLSAV